MTKRIVLCADDYGQAPPISKGILALAEQNRLSATSCLVNGPHWREHAEWLKPFWGKIDIGLHLNLTEGAPLSHAYQNEYGKEFFSLTTLMRKSLLRQLNQDIIEAECRAQLDQFAQVMGTLPDFIDGHQHVHQFPTIRDALIQIYEERLRHHHTYVRWINESLSPKNGFINIKKIIIYLMGTKAFKVLLNQHDIPHNESFSGVYSFSKNAKYGELFNQFLQEVGDKGLLMCHPGLKASEGSDSIAEARFLEYQYFASDEFLEDCRGQEVVLGRFSQVL